MKPLQANIVSPLWPLLGVFLVINILLSYISLSLATWLILLLVLGLLVFLGFRIDRDASSESYDLTLIPGFNPPFWVWGAIGGVAILLRFGMLTSFEGWPGGDDSLQGLFAIDLNRHWNWRMFYTTGQHPPLWIWFLSLFYRFSSNSAFNLWFPPALVSSLFVLVSTLAVRRFVPRGMAFPFFLSLSLGFWPLYFGRFCVQADLVPLFEALAFLCLGGLWNAEGDLSGKLWAAALGLSVGVGAYSYMGFLSVVVLVSLAVLALGLNKKEKIRTGCLYLLILLGALLPLGLACLSERVGGYIFGASFLGGLYSWKAEVAHATSYVTTLFWGPLGSGADYGPVWGGFLNPVECAFFFLGLLTIRGWRNSAPKWFLGVAFFIFLLPGLLTADQVEMLRVIPVMPFLYLVTCLGFLDLWRKAGTRMGRTLLILLAFVSIGLNLFHLAEVRSKDGPLSEKLSYQERANEGYLAYRTLQDASQTRGPGLVFTDFLLLARDHALHVMTFPFNALLNSKLDPSQAQWAGIQTNFHYGAFLQKRFPDSQWQYVTPPGENPERRADGGSVVGIIPITPENRKVFAQWTETHEYLNDLSVEAENSMNDQDLYSQQVEKLPAGYALVRGDPFLESVYGEWVAQYHVGSNLDSNVRALERAIQMGYPAANLFFKLGNFLAGENRISEAEKAFALAARCQPNHTQAEVYLKALQNQASSK